jgi:hypothetical protein
MLVRELLEAALDHNAKSMFHFGFEDDGNAKKSKAAFKEAGIEFDTDSNGGITYFYFRNSKDMWKGIHAANKVIDKSKDTEWAEETEA